MQLRIRPLASVQLLLLCVGGGGCHAIAGGTRSALRATTRRGAIVTCALPSFLPGDDGNNNKRKPSGAERQQMMDTLFDTEEQVQQLTSRQAEPDPEIPSHISLEIEDGDGEPVLARFTYVDEDTCIGCKNCAFVARNTFFMEESFAGKARVFNQGGDSDEIIDEAIDTCPVNCIHYVAHEDLVTLERERLQREQNVDFNNYAAFKKAWTGQDAAVPETKAKYYGSLAMGNRCNNCPSRGCAQCPMFGVGQNPIYMRREQARQERRERSGAAAREAADEEKQRRIDILFGQESGGAAAGSGLRGADPFDDDAFAASFFGEYAIGEEEEEEKKPRAAPPPAADDAAIKAASARLREVLEDDGAEANDALDPYAVLGVRKDASLADIKRAFRRLAMRWHPDRCASLPEVERLQAELIFKQVALANEVLTDAAKRRQYDAGKASLSELVKGYWESLSARMRKSGGGGSEVKGSVTPVAMGSGVALEELLEEEKAEEPESPFLMLAAPVASATAAEPGEGGGEALDADGKPRQAGVKYDYWGRPMA